MSKYIIMGVLGLSMIGISAASGIITLPDEIGGIIQHYTSKINLIKFNQGGNNFQGVVIRNEPQTLNTPETITYQSETILCNKRIKGIYYNNQRGARRWPLDNTTRTSLINIDSSYTNIQLSGGLFTDCGGNKNAVYGQLTHILTGALSGEYKLAAGLNYNFANNSINTTELGETLIGGITNQTSGYIYDSAGGIGLISGSVGISIPSGTPPTTPSSPTGGRGGGSTTITQTTGEINIDTQAQTEETILPTTRLCNYDNVPYADNGPFSDTIGHRGFDYIEILRISCINQGRGRSRGLWIYEPNANITRAEVLKTVSKILGAAFEELVVTDEQQLYTGNLPFVDTPNWFNHYADYAFKNGLTAGLYSTDAEGKRYIDPDKAISRYEAIKIMMLAYNKINQSMITISGSSVMGDVIDPNNTYYNYVRQAEILEFISGVPQTDGSYNFEGIRNLTRAEFAKIIGVPFAEQLFNIEQIIYQSDIYQKIIQGIQQSQNPMTFVQALYNEMKNLSDTAFIRQYKVPKQLFLEVLYNDIIQPLIP